MALPWLHTSHLDFLLNSINFIHWPWFQEMWIYEHCREEGESSMCRLHQDGNWWLFVWQESIRTGLPNRQRGRSLHVRSHEKGFIVTQMCIQKVSWTILIAGIHLTCSTAFFYQWFRSVVCRLCLANQVQLDRRKTNLYKPCCICISEI